MRAPPAEAAGERGRDGNSGEAALLRGVVAMFPVLAYNCEKRGLILYHLRTAALTLLICAALMASPARAGVTLHLFGYEGEEVDAVIDWGSAEAC